MPYVIVRGNLTSLDNSSIPFKVSVSGLKADDILNLKRFQCGGYPDDFTISFYQHPCVILTALEVLGYKVVASSSSSTNKHEYMWTMRKEFSEPEPATVNSESDIQS